MTGSPGQSPTVSPTAIGQLLSARATTHADAVALLEPGLEPLSYQALQRDVDGLQRQLRAHGVEAGHRLALVMPNSSATALLILALMDSCTLVPINPDYRRREYESLFRRIRVDALVTSLDADHAACASAEAVAIPRIEATPGATRSGELGLTFPPGMTLPAPAAPGAAGYPPLVLHTSGSTASPKIVPLYAGNLLASIDNLVKSLQLSPQDRCLNMMPMFHIGAILDLWLASISVGASMVAPTGNNAETFFRCVREFEPSWYQGVPTMLRDIVTGLNVTADALAGCTPLRLVRSVSSALPNRLLHDIESQLQTRVIEIYGMTETCGVICSNPLAEGRQKPGSVGLPQGCEVRVIDAAGKSLAPGERGEVVVRGANVMPAYEDRGDEGADDFSDGYFRTGDEAYFDAEGYLYLCGRIKEIINRGGEKISPLEIDRIAEQYPAVQAAAAFAVPHASLGEEVGLAVIRERRQDYDEGEFVDFLKSRLAGHKMPRRIFYPDKLPRAAGGKLRRHLLTQQALDAEQAAAQQPWVAPQSPLAIELAGLWQRAIDVDEIGLHDNFFDRGGDSLSAAAVIAELQRRFPAVRPSVLYDHPQLQALETHLLGLADSGDQGAEQMVATAEINAVMQPFMSAWRGERLHSDALIAGRNCAGSRCPLFWCVNGYSEFDMLAELMGAEQPLYGMRSLFDTGYKSDAATLQLAKMYFDELRQIQPRGPYLVGGFCEGGKIAFLLAQMLRDKGETVASLMLQEQFVASPYSGRVAIFICRPGRNNPYYNFADATRGWRKFYSGDLQLYRFNGRHKDCYSRPDVEFVCRQLQREMQRALAYRHDDAIDRRNRLQRLPLDAYRAELQAHPPQRLRPGARFRVDVEVTNRSSFDWMPTPQSGLVLGAKWLKSSGETRQWMAAVGDLPQVLHPGDSVTIPLDLRAPMRLRSHYLELDLVDDGVSWFADMGSPSNRHLIDIRIL